MVGVGKCKQLNLDVRNIFAGSPTEHCWRCSCIVYSSTMKYISLPHEGDPWHLWTGKNVLWQCAGYRLCKRFGSAARHFLCMALCSVGMLTWYYLCLQNFSFLVCNSLLKTHHHHQLIKLHGSSVPRILTSVMIPCSGRSSRQAW